VKRWPQNPILTRNDIPRIEPDLVDVSSVFNPGAVLYRDDVVLMLRVQNRGRETFFLTARSRDGIHFNVDPTIVRLEGLERVRETIYHVYDARITRFGDEYFLMFALDMDSGCRLGLAATSDFKTFEFRGIVSENDTRNGVLFPEKIHGKYLRLERPNTVSLQGGPVSGSSIWLGESEDLLTWKPVSEIVTGRFHYWDELIGPGAPPIKTRYGWLCIYHGVATHFASSNIYQAGIFVLDLENPSRVLGRSRQNILEPRELYELTGQVSNVVFPSGAVAREVDAEGFVSLDSDIFVYYGAADTCIGLATTTARELLTAAGISGLE
jgi:beta-1,4-mannooligosaccharide/beta-1,4-mannosyl-N-acetylglucosamine phosphorylase